MKKILLSTFLALAAATVFASTQTKTTQDKPWRIYLLGATVNTSDNNHSFENYYYYPDYPQSNLVATADKQTTSGKFVAWVNGLGGGGSGTALNTSIAEGFYYYYTNYGNSFEIDSINLDWLGDGNQYENHHLWGSNSGNSYDYPNFYPFNFSVTISSYVANEHCDVTDSAHPPFWSYVYYTYDLGPVLRQIINTETYQRYAQAVWHVQTGGKAIPARQNLWRFNGSASEILDKRAGPPFTGAARREITNKAQIAIGELGNLKADGNLWLTLPDNVDKDITPMLAGKDFYTFGVVGQKYTLTVLASSSTTNADLSTDTPEFCVGQKVTFVPSWNPGVPPFTNAIYHWHLPAKYVNERIVQPFSGSPASTSYQINSDLLTSNSTSCWFVNGQDGACSVGMSLQFTNGQIVPIAAARNLTVYRPTFSNYVNNFNFFTWNNPILQANMAWRVTLDCKYDGLFGVTQIINANGGIYDNGGNDYLDGNSEIYGDQVYSGDGPQAYVAANPATHTTIFLDTPSTPTIFPPCPAMVADFKDYLRFQPSGNNTIYVTIGTNGWHMDGQACSWGIDHTNLPPASAMATSDMFPLWHGVRHN